MPTPWLKQNGRCLRMAFTMFATSFLSMVLVYTLLGNIHHLIYIWPLTGVQLALLLPEWGKCRQRIMSIVAGSAGVLGGGLLMGLPFWFALSLSCINAPEVWLTGFILQRGIRSFEDLKWRKNLVLFFIAAIAGPATAGAFASLPVAIFLHQFHLTTTIISAFSDSLGMAVFLPALLFALTGEYRSWSKLAPFMHRIIPAILFFAAVSLAVFRQQHTPLIFLIFPPLILVVFAMGLEGAVFASIVLFLIAGYETAHGDGPLWLASAASASFEEHLLLLQIFLWMSTATILPVGALLDEQRHSENEAQSARTIYQTLLQHTDDMIILSSIDGSQRYVSAACEKLTGWTPEQFCALDRLATFHPDDHEMANLVIQSILEGRSEQTFRYRIAQKDGRWKWVEATVISYPNEGTGKVAGYVVTVRDIEEYMQIEEAWHKERHALTALALTDTLTGLANRRAFQEALQADMHRMHRDNTRLILMMIDVDFFKSYNDIYGHAAGDECLRSLAAALKNQTGRAVDMVARWGGEEFIVLLYGTTLDGGRQVAQRMLESIRELRIEHTGSPKEIVTVSIGMAEAEARSENDLNLWIQRADRALYRSKHAGKDRFTVDGAEPLLVKGSRNMEAR
jgi:diguanylate cyclase (GGDEF)-like protein/PAS domain S-box-containing protein